MELLYEAHAKSITVAEVISTLPMAPDRYAGRVAVGADEHRAEADALITKFARADWSVDRLPLIDRIVLRMAVYELTYELDVPRGVVLDEAVELAKTFSAEESGKFVNGILTSITDDLGR